MAASSSSSSPISSSYPVSDFQIVDNKLYLLGKEGADAEAYAITIKKTSAKKTSIFSSYITIQGTLQGKRVKLVVNASSVAKKLGLKKSKVKEIAKQINGIYPLRRAAAIHRFMKNQKIEEDYKIKLNTKYKNSEIKTFKAGGKKEKQRYFIDSKNFNLYSSERIGEGSYGKMFKIINLIEPTTPPLAVKKAKRKTRDAIEELKKEADALKSINPSGIIRGIQAGPILASEHAYVTHYYDSDLSKMSSTEKFHNMAPKDKLKLMGQLLIGLASLHELGYFHGDIKPENCLMKEDETPERKIAHVVLSDFGGVNEISTWDAEYSEFVFTPQYIAPELRSLEEHPASILQSNDVFALSKTIIEVLIDSSIVISISSEKAKLRFTPEEIEKLKTIIPERLAEVLIDGMRKPLSRGLTAAQFLSKFKAAFMEVYGEDFLLKD